MEKDGRLKTISAKGLHYRQLNEEIRKVLEEGYQQIKIMDVNGQRYIGSGLTFSDRILEIYGTPGNDLGAFMNGLTIRVFGNAQDGTANTMNGGEIVIYGSTGDLVGYGMRGGRVFIRGSAGYRVGIHMKEYEDKIPVIVIGGNTGDFLGEYMAGGRIIVLNLESQGDATGYFCGTGMHGGIIYIRGTVPEHRLGKEVKLTDINEEDIAILKEHLIDFARYFGISLEYLISEKFYKLVPYNKRPYGRLYAY
ncbi:MAG: hypothetical protein N2380_01305 [bacterium]|nr:hypothetical protein [bacterium]